MKSTNKNKKNSNLYKILIVPNVRAAYDGRMVRDFAIAFNQLGHQAQALKSPLLPSDLSLYVSEGSFDVVLEINRVRNHNYQLPKNVRYISWFQDVFPGDKKLTKDDIQDQDIFYTLGDSKVLGINAENVDCFKSSLFTGVSDEVLKFKSPSFDKIDFSMCGFIPAPLTNIKNPDVDIIWYIDKIVKSFPLLGRTRLANLIRRAIFRGRLPVDYLPYSLLMNVRDIMESNYQPLRGDLDIHKLSRALDIVLMSYIERPNIKKKSKKIYKKTSLFEKLMKDYSIGSDLALKKKSVQYRFFVSLLLKSRHTNFDKYSEIVDYFSQTYPRLLDRQYYINEILKVSEDIELYGLNWNLYPKYAQFYHGNLNNQEDLFTVYQKSCMNLCNNTHGLGLHSRTLECMGVGGFIFMHSSPNENLPGGMLTAFEPGIHYGSFDHDDIQEQARYWLYNSRRRTIICAQAKKIIADKHTWRDRAKQVINDLNK